MAFDYGSIDLGLRNPFKLEGAVTTLRGAVQALIAVYLLFLAATSVRQDPVEGWTVMLFGMVLLAVGVRACASGILAMLRYFVGRNHPTSLARNYSKSQASSAHEETSVVAYSAEQLEEMLMGRKNMTFTEPVGLLARFLHTLFRNLLFMPYPIRNLAQRLFGAWVETLTMLLAYAFAAFVSLAGFAGELGERAFPVYSILLMLYLLRVWSRAARPVSRNGERMVQTKSEISLPKIITLAIMFPVVVGLALGWVVNNTRLDLARLDELQSALPGIHPGFVIAGVLILAALATALIFVALKIRISQCDPKVEVSELRENWQESVHPNEIFINLDNLVMANRRYKEVPNRVYRELDPRLKEQVNGKGDFFGEMIQEVQPRVREVDFGATFRKIRLIALIAGNLLLLTATMFTLIIAFDLVDLFKLYGSMDSARPFASLQSEQTQSLLSDMAVILQLLIWAGVIRIFGRMLANAAHLFFSEIQFDSILVYFKCEGTFSESKISTGTGIHDSTRSENVLVRSSITPWVIVTRIVSTVFASTGMKNLEHPRHILEMHRADEELSDIRADVVGFLKDRESIAAITSERDLNNASQIYQMNEQTRAVPVANSLEQDDEAAGYLRRESEVEMGSDDEQNPDEERQRQDR